MKLAIGVLLSLVLSSAVSNPFGKLEREDDSEEDALSEVDALNALDEYAYESLDEYDSEETREDSQPVIGEAAEQELQDQYDYYYNYDYYENSEETREDNESLREGCKDEYEYCDEMSEYCDGLKYRPPGSFGFHLDIECRKTCGYC